MPFPRKFFRLVSRSFTAAAATTKPRSKKVPKVRAINKVDSKYRSFVVNESQKALTEYLHLTRSVPFYFAEQISKNSPFCLSGLIANLRFSAPTFPTTIRTLLRYTPITEFEFFFESIGINHIDIAKYLPRNKHFLFQDKALFESASALSHFGFPWRSLGILYAERSSIFAMSSSELNSRLDEIGESGVSDNLYAVGACLAFPFLLSQRGVSDPLLLEDLKRVFEKRDISNFSVDDWVDVCYKVRVFYELGCEKGTVGEPFRDKMRLFLDCPKHVIEDIAEYFSEFLGGGKKEEVGLMLLRNPEVFTSDFRTPAISVFGLLEHFGLNSEELSFVSSKYPHVFGRNKMGNLPRIVRALDLHEWFFDKIKSSDCWLLTTYVASHPDQDVDTKFVDEMKRKTTESSRTWVYRTSKLESLKAIGFGENGLTMSVLRSLKVNADSLQERFDFLLGLGIRYSKLCSMMKVSPGIFHQNSELLESKINYLCKEMGSSLEYLDYFPRFLFHNLENRIKPRHRFYLWLREIGFYTKEYSIKTIIDCSEKRFIAHLSKIHPSVPKHYLEGFLQKGSNNDCQETN